MTIWRSPRARVERNLGVPGVDVQVDHYYPTGDDLGLLVWIRTPYGRKGMSSIAKRFAKAGAHVLLEETRGDLMTFATEDAAAVAAWLRSQAWFPGTIASWGISAIGYASWALAAIDIPEWRLAILQDAQSDLRNAVLYPGGAFAGSVALSYVHAVEWHAKHPRGSLPRSLLASVRGARRARKVLAELPVGTADQRLVGHRVDYGIRRLRPDSPPPAADGTRTVTVDLVGAAHCFRAGHRLRVQVSGGAHPRFVRNTGTGEPLATATTLRAADVEVFHGSRIVLPHAVPEPS